MNDTDERRAYVARIMLRLRTAYGARLLLPRCDGRHVAPCEELLTGFCTCTHQDGYTMGLMQLQLLYRRVLTEGYGE